MLAGEDGLEAKRNAGVYTQPKDLDSQACGGSHVDSPNVLTLILVVVLPLLRECKNEKGRLLLRQSRHVA